MNFSSGGVVVHATPSRGLLLELNSETDFAAREPEFVKTLRSISQTLLNSSNVLVKDHSTPTVLGLFSFSLES